MDSYFRWILLLIAVLLLAYIYWSGRRKPSNTSNIPGHVGEESDPLFTDHRAERKMSDPGNSLSDADAFDSFEPMTPNAPAAHPEPEPALSRDDDLEFFTPIENFEQEPEEQSHQGRLFSSIAEKIEAFSARLTPKRSERMQAHAAKTQGKPEHTGEEKIISLNVMAPEGYLLDGAEMYAIFMQRGYQFGEMGLFHSRYKDHTIFSIVNMVEPGSFDVTTIESLQTPGITLFLQLPGPIAADVLFEVLVSEASDLANALGGTVRDSQRSTLTKQTVQHLREDIYAYMHREKYFNAR